MFTFADCTVDQGGRDEAGLWVIAPDGSKRFYYLIRFDEAGHETLKWLEARGYDCGMFEALEDASKLGSRDMCAIREHKAWEIQEASTDADSGFACLSWDSAPGREIRRFLDSIV